MGALIWPLAETEAQKYKEVLDTLERTRSSIDEAANIDDVVLNPRTFIDYSNALYGEYHDTYSEKVNDWAESGKKIKDGFIRFQTSRDLVYLEASTQYGIWFARIGLRYPDPPESATGS